MLALCTVNWSPSIFCFSSKVMCIADKKRKPVLILYAVTLVCNTQVYLYSGLTKMAERQLQFLHNLSLQQLSKKKPQRFLLLKKVSFQIRHHCFRWSEWERERESEEESGRERGERREQRSSHLSQSTCIDLDTAGMFQCSSSQVCEEASGVYKEAI